MLINIPLQDLRAPQALASFNGASSYRLEGDQALLSADVSLASDAASDSEWALQLWACEAGAAPSYCMIAELPIMSFEFQAITVEGWARLQPPISPAAHGMTLVLACGRAGVFDEIHDVVEFAQTEVFLQPRFVGELSVSRDAEKLSLNTPAVTNPRREDNLSGTLSVELWALTDPYTGGAFTGVQLESVMLGVLGGQATAGSRSLHVPLAQIAPAAVLTVMLREWTALGYLTRDVRCIDQLPDQAASAASKTAAKGKRATAAKPAVAGTVSINAASEAELAALKGLSRAAASGIVAARPYASVDEVVRAKGIGEKLLARLRSFLSL